MNIWKSRNEIPMQITAHRRDGMKSFDVANGRSSDRKWKMPTAQNGVKSKCKDIASHTHTQTKSVSEREFGMKLMVNYSSIILRALFVLCGFPSTHTCTYVFLLCVCMCTPKWWTHQKFEIFLFSAFREWC